MNPSPIKVYFLFMIAVLALVVVLIITSRSQKDNGASVKSFEACAKAGYPIMESYPRQCTLPGGKFFVEGVMKER